MCLPFAGGGASFFTQWREHTSDFDILPVLLPGRERRIDDAPYRNVQRAANGVLPEILEQVDRKRPVVLFGHSLGAVLAYEITQRLVNYTDLTVSRLIVSGSPGPATQREKRATGLSDDDFITRVREFAGFSDAAMAAPQIRSMILPALRADVEMHENYRPSSRTPLPVPITSIRGGSDDLVSDAQAREWQAETSVDFTFVEPSGGHMYLVDSPDAVLQSARP
ncbi:alpha/beta fold hydrolase [Nocardia sp. NPDC050712]|uniref:thioesterase II family protein n=1 Tax=Nocardia sp. NPDC050712 TaxID=3155518 RepID=UPI0033F6F4E3